jgi:hypothetical protein
MDTDVLGQVIGTVKHLPGYGPGTRLAVYSRDGFTSFFAQRAKKGVILRTVEDLFA